MSRPLPVLLAALAATVAVLAGCSGVPSSSSPRVIRPGIGDTSDTLPTNTPQPDAEPRAIVQEFLRANADEPLEARGVRQFLTPPAQRSWSDSFVTILQGSVEDAKVGFARPTGSNSVSVRVEGTQIGSVNSDGVYLPTANGAGAPWSHEYTLQQVNGQSRISALPDGLVVYATDFSRVYQAVRLYFLDLREKRLVPDVRYSGLGSNKAALASWALNQLTAPPRGDLTNAVRTEVPSLPAATPPSVALDGQIARVNIPGSSRLEDDVKAKLAAQLLATMDSVQPQVGLRLTDGGTPVDVMGANDHPITKDDFTAHMSQSAPGAQSHFFDGLDVARLFYVDGSGRLVTGSGEPVEGPLGTHAVYNLNSVAITSPRKSDDYYVAACIGTGARQSLWVGRSSIGLRQIDLSGRLTRPSWLAGQREVWIAKGAGLYRVDYSGAVQRVPTTLPPGATITAMRLSPEGSRIAMIVRDAAGTQLYVGSIIRIDSVPTQGSTARLDGVEPILPPRYKLTDVAWGDDMTLWAIGGSDNGIWSVNVDGSNLQPISTSGLPQPQRIDSITIGRGAAAAWVSAGGYVFERGTDWEGPGHRTTRGRNPVYQDSYLD